MRATNCNLQAECLAKAYADDIAIVVRDVVMSLTDMALLFRVYGDISCLRLNSQTCVLVPLWEVDALCLKANTHRHGSKLEQFQDCQIWKKDQFLLNKSMSTQINMNYCCLLLIYTL